MSRHGFAVLGSGLVVVLVAVVSCGSPGSGPATATVTVNTSSMFSYAGADGLTVSGAAGVAAPGVHVKITPQVQPQVGGLDKLTYLGRSVDIVIGENAQPKAPITVGIPIPNGFDEKVSTAVAVTERDGKPEFLEVADRAGNLSTTLTHLSPVDFVGVDLAKFVKGVTDSIGSLLTGESTRAPDCLEKSIDAGGVKFKANRTRNESGGNLDAVWPCLRFEYGQILLDLHANGNRAWLTRSEPDVGAGDLSTPSSGAATASGFFQVLYNLGKRRSTGTLMPATTLTYSFSSDHPPTRAEVMVDPGLILTAALVYELTAIFDITGASTADKLEKVPGTYDCLLGAANTLDSANKNFVDNATSAFQTIVGCMSAVVPGPMAFMLNIFGGGATIVSGLLTSAWNEITHNNHGVITIDRSDQSASATATDHGYGTLALGMTKDQALSALGGKVDKTFQTRTCTIIKFTTPAGDARALIMGNTLSVIDTPPGTLTDRRVGDGSTTADIQAAYGRDHAVETTNTQAGPSVFVTTGDPSKVGYGNPGGLIGFAVRDGGKLGPPEVGGVPGFEYCAG